MARISKWLHVAGIGFVTAITGCSFEPYNGEHYSTTRSTVTFEGCSTHPNSPIAITAARVVDPHEVFPSAPPPGNFATIGGTASSSTVTETDSTGTNWYCWSASGVVPAGFWSQLGASINSPLAPGLYSTWVRLLDNGSPVWTYFSDPRSCPQNPGAAQLTNASPCAFSPSTATNPNGGAVNILANTL